MTHLDPRDVFKHAIKRGKLTLNPNDDLYAGNWMYMHTENDVHYFKNILTRQYMKVER